MGEEWKDGVSAPYLVSGCVYMEEAVAREEEGGGLFTQHKTLETRGICQGMDASGRGKVQ